MYLTKPEAPAHWYTPAGEPCYTVQSQDGSERPTTLRDARVLGLYPSVTSVLSVLSSPVLMAWRLEQAILSALTLPRQDGEDDQTFAGRVLQDMARESDSAAQAGTELHAFLEGWHQDPSAPLPPGAWFAPHIEHYAKWFDAEGRDVLAVEVPFAHRSGFGGRVDLVLGSTPYDIQDRPIIIDWKSRKTKPGQPVTPYDHWLIQLAAYGLYWGAMRGINIVFSTTEPGRVDIIRHDLREMWRGKQMWLSCFELWKLSHRYDPLEPKGEEQ